MSNSAAHVITKLGGIKPTARLAGVSIHAVYGWTYAGRIPAKRQRALLDAARAEGLALEPADFFHDGAADAAA
ncbi:MAG TPA: hypothetical protein PLV92_06280 [Pirellulaceae bacterium]|nr:hypothetical protein [Pirellulaceae bacterium]